MLIPAFRIFAKTPLDDLFQLHRQSAVLERGPFGFIAQDRRQNRSRGTAAESPLARSHFVQHRAKREDVRLGRSAFSLRLFRRHVSASPGDRSSRGLDPRVLLLKACQPKVDDLGGALRRDEYIGGLQIAVDDTGVVRCLQSRGDFFGIAERFRRRDGPPPQDFREGLTRNVLHDEEVRILIGCNIVDHNDVRVAEFRCCAGLPGKLAAVFLFVDRRKRLDCHEPVEACIEGLVNQSHSADTDLLENAIVQYRIAGQQDTSPPRDVAYSIAAVLRCARAQLDK